MTKKELIAAVSATTGAIKSRTEDVINQMLVEITNALKDGDKVQIPGFGTFEVKESPEREGRNPKTGEPMMIKASKTPKFKAGKTLKDALN